MPRRSRAKTGLDGRAYRKVWGQTLYNPSSGPRAFPKNPRRLPPGTFRFCCYTPD